MKKIFFLFMMLISANALFAQTTVEFTYDVAGNRILRKTIPVDLSKKSAAMPIEEQLDEQLKVTVYPNPTKGDLSIGINGAADDSEFRYTLYGLNGKHLKDGLLGNNGRHPISIEDYKAGIYIMVLQGQGKRIDYKIIKE